MFHRGFFFPRVDTIIFSPTGTPVVSKDDAFCFRWIIRKWLKRLIHLVKNFFITACNDSFLVKIN